MKRVLIIMQILLFFTPFINGQIEYEATLDSIAKKIQFDDGVVRYYMIDVEGNVLNIYDVDKSLWKSIQLEASMNESLMEIKLLSSNIFSEVNTIEVDYTTIWYELATEGIESSDGVMTSPQYRFFIIDESGIKPLKVREDQELIDISSHQRKRFLINWGDKLSGFDAEILNNITNMMNF